MYAESPQSFARAHTSSRECAHHAMDARNRTIPTRDVTARDVVSRVVVANVVSNAPRAMPRIDARVVFETR